MVKLRATVLAGLLLAVVLVGSASPAAASCAPPLSLADALTNSDLVVVGTVTAARSANRIATVNVEDLWKGDADAQIEVAGGPDTLSGGTSVDRTYVVGQRYLFFILMPGVHGNAGTFGARYEDNVCTDTRPYTGDLEQLRPASARRIAAPTTSSPESSSSTTASPSSRDSKGTLIAFVVGGVLVCAALAAGGWRLRHRADPPRE